MHHARMRGSAGRATSSSTAAPGIRERDRSGRQTELAHQIQVRALEVGTHAYVGQCIQPMAYRNTVSGVVHGPAPFFWNVSKSE